MTAVEIPYDQLSPEALQGVIEKFVIRDGTCEINLISNIEHFGRYLLNKLYFYQS